MPDEALARKMYQSYNDQTPNPWKTFDGRSVPPWDQLNDQVRAKWCAAARTALSVVGKTDKERVQRTDPSHNDCG